MKRNSPGYGGIKIVFHHNVQFLSDPADIRHVNLRQGSGNRSFQHPDFRRRIKMRCNFFSQFRNRDPSIRADIEYSTVMRRIIDRKQSAHKIIGVKIGTVRRTVSGNDDLFLIQSVADEIADRKMDIQRKTRSGEGKTADYPGGNA